MPFDLSARVAEPFLDIDIASLPNAVGVIETSVGEN